MLLLVALGPIASASIADGQCATAGPPCSYVSRAGSGLNGLGRERAEPVGRAGASIAYDSFRVVVRSGIVGIPVALALADLRPLAWWPMVLGVAVAFLVIGAGFRCWRTMVHALHSFRQAAGPQRGTASETVAARSQNAADEAGSSNRRSVDLPDFPHQPEHHMSERPRELHESREFAEQLLNSIDHRVIVIDRSFRIVRANAAAVRMYGLELVDSPCYEVFEGRTIPCTNCAAARTFASGTPASEERSQQTRAGLEVLQLETYPIAGTDGTVEAVIEIGRIVTAEKQLQLQIMHQEKMASFGLLAAGIAHDIGNPLAAIESQLQLARQQPHRQDETLIVVGREVARISRMLRELVDFSRRRRDALILVSANQVIEDVTRLLCHDPRARGVTITHRFTANLPGVRTTEDHLFQVLFNLGLNALDAMPGGGSLEFATSSRGGWIVIRVRDTGAGIPTDLHAHLFEPFFTTKGPERGTGLGLFVSKTMVERMGGELLLEHTDNRGSVFAAFLPIPTVGGNGASP